MRKEDLEPSLLLAPKSLLVGKELFHDRLFAARVVSYSRVLEHNSHAVVPSPVFGGVIARAHRTDFQDASVLDLFLQNGKVILLEQAYELVGVTPFGLVVVIGNKRFVVRLRLSCADRQARPEYEQD